MDEKTLKKKTVAELRAMAKKESLPLRSKMVKAELIALILGKAGATKGGVKRAGQLKRAVQVKKEAPRKATAPMAEPMTEAMLKKKTIAELRQLAKARSIPLRSTLRKTDLVRLLLEKDGSKKEDREDQIEAPMPRAEVRPTPTAEPYADIPAGYGVNRIAAMARDPAWIYAYWEITPDGLAEGKRRVEDGEAKLTLRVGDLTEGTERASSFDVEIYHRIGNWYIEVG
ncbi:MAG TPA: DUF4912 domain-containing protein, partial [Nitrospiria bacterium]|nr:DUF4912 domain-containing protein [Nitrospiria bacterium]